MRAITRRVDELVALAIVVRVRGRHVALDRVGELEVTDRVERLRVELDRQRRLRHRDVALADARQIHVRVVREVRREDRLHALEQRAAGVGGEAAVADLALSGVAVGAALEETALVGDGTVREAEAVQHRDPVEPVRHAPVADLEQRRRDAHERAGQPGRHLPADGQAVDRHLLVEALEAEPVVRRLGLRECGCHDPQCTVYFGLMQEVRLTPPSYIVLGLLSWTDEATPYRLKQLVAGSVGFFWSLQHAQLYTEPERLARGGYVSERREEGGRRRQLYKLTDRGRETSAC